MTSSPSCPLEEQGEVEPAKHAYPNKDKHAALTP
jgi:hypothetical protein